jgi:hypothetical protein
MLGQQGIVEDRMEVLVLVEIVDVGVVDVGVLVAVGVGIFVAAYEPDERHKETKCCCVS